MKGWKWPIALALHLFFFFFFFSHFLFRDIVIVGRDMRKPSERVVDFPWKCSECHTESWKFFLSILFFCFFDFIQFPLTDPVRFECCSCVYWMAKNLKCENSSNTFGTQVLSFPAATLNFFGVLHPSNRSAAETNIGAPKCHFAGQLFFWSCCCFVCVLRMMALVIALFIFRSDRLAEAVRHAIRHAMVCLLERVGKIYVAFDYVYYSTPSRRLIYSPTTSFFSAFFLFYFFGYSDCVCVLKYTRAKGQVTRQQHHSGLWIRKCRGFLLVFVPRAGLPRRPVRGHLCFLRIASKKKMIYIYLWISKGKPEEKEWDLGHQQGGGTGNSDRPPTSAGKKCKFETRHRWRCHVLFYFFFFFFFVSFLLYIYMHAVVAVAFLNLGFVNEEQKVIL